MSQNAGYGGSCRESTNEFSCAHGAQINFGDLTPYLTYGLHEGNTEEENNGYVVFKEISRDQLGNRVMVRGEMLLCPTSDT
jgi:hypothetical protein